MRGDKRAGGNAGKRTVIHCLTLGLSAVALCLAVCGTDLVFGAKVDWFSQHSAIPDYFRRQFYQTGSLFPEFAAQLGGGQNIYNYSYYGLYSPVILFSYLLPFVRMSDYLMAAGIVCLTASVLLFYRWLAQWGISPTIRFLTSCLFLLAGPMVYHSCHQVMFVNYMPFLCLALTGVDQYFQTGRAGKYTVSVFLMIMTSFYFSIGGMMVLALYGVFRYVRMHEQQERAIRVREMIGDGCRFLIPMMQAVLMSAVLLVPTAFCLAGRSQETGAGTDGMPSVAELLCPGVEVFRLVYSPYGVGLTTIVLTVLITGCFYRRTSERVLHIGCLVVLTIPVFAWLLNGGLYVRGKVMIPFLPLLCCLIAFYMEKLRRDEIPFLRGMIPYAMTLAVLWAGRSQETYCLYWVPVMAEGVLTLLCYLITGYCACKCMDVKCNRYRAEILAGLSAVILAGYGIAVSRSDTKLLDRTFYHKTVSEENGEAVRQALGQEDGFYRTEQHGSTADNEANLNRIWDMDQYISSIYSSAYNEEYQRFRTDTFGVEQPYRNLLMQPVSANPIFQRLMGVKYVISEKEVPGYEKAGTSGSLGIYVREDVLPVIYSTDRVIPESRYRQLGFPYRQAVFAGYAVVPDHVPDGRDMGQESVEEIVRASCRISPLPVEIPDDAPWLERQDQGIRIKTNHNKNVQIPISVPEDADTLFLRFQVRNLKPSADVAVWVEGVKNKLSAEEHIYYNHNTEFTYVIPLEKGQKGLHLTFGKGAYEITEMECMTGVLRAAHPSVLPEEDSGDRMQGTLTGESETGEMLCQSAFQIDREQSGGSRITGDISVGKEGWMITSIPYDSHFQVEIDGKEVPVYRVNTAFLGVKVEPGDHRAEIIFHAPGARAGRLLSLLGILLFVLSCWRSGRNRSNTL